MKWWGMICVMLCCAGTGILAAGKLRRDVQALEALCAWMTAASAMMRYECPDCREWLLRMGDEPQFAGFTFAGETARMLSPLCPPLECWACAVSADAAIPDAARESLLHLGASLGSTDLEGQLAALSLCRERLETALVQARENARVRGKLYRALGLLTGAMAGVMIL